MTLHSPILLSTAGFNALSVIVPFVLSASLMAILYFIMRAVHKKRHPTEDDIKETNRKRREREKLERETMAKVSSKLAEKRRGEESSENDEYEKRGLRSGKYKKKKKK